MRLSRARPLWPVLICHPRVRATPAPKLSAGGAAAPAVPMRGERLRTLAGGEAERGVMCAADAVTLLGTPRVGKACACSCSGPPPEPTSGVKVEIHCLQACDVKETEGRRAVSESVDGG